VNTPEAPITQTIASAGETVYVSRKVSIWPRRGTNTWGQHCLGGYGRHELRDSLHTAGQHRHSPIRSDTRRPPVPGIRVGHRPPGEEIDKRSFRFSEQGGVLRVATSLGDAWNLTSRTRLSLLRPATVNNGVSLEVISFIDNIGQPGEKLYAVRYAGQRAYLVTFRITDPLYVFDLSQPETPIKLGELHIDGYSDYLHPIGDSLLLGLGKALCRTRLPAISGAGAPGIKGSSFPSLMSPTLPPSVRFPRSSSVSGDPIGRFGGSPRPVLSAARQSEPARLAIPVQLYDTLPADPRLIPQNPGHIMIGPKQACTFSRSIQVQLPANLPGYGPSARWW